MNEIENLKTERLLETFNRNGRLASLYADYLNNYPDIICEEMICALTEDGDVSVKEALVALLSEIFKLDYENKADRAIIRDYLTPSVRTLDTSKYENNPYYKNIKLENIKEDNWEIQIEEYKPYRGFICDDLQIGDDFSEIPPLGFFSKSFKFPAILENGNEWMTLTPVDLDTCDEAIDAAHGKVVTFGLGLGYYAYMVAEKPEVESVTVVELSRGVINLFERYILPQIPSRHKIKIVNADAFEYAENQMGKERFDVAFVDTWRDASDGAPMYERMKGLEKHSPATKFYYWIENFLISNLRLSKLSLLMSRGQFSYDKIVREIQKERVYISDFDIFCK